ncbi:MAG: hypothetical protein ACT4O5_15750 [Gammaproteobacteria bacterium]
MTRILNAFQALAWIFLLCLVAVVGGAQVTSTRIDSASWTCRDTAGAILTSHERQDKAQEECTNRALKSPGTAFEIRPSGFRIVAVAAVTPPQTTGSATIRWTPPGQNTDGSTLTNLAGYRISYGTSPTALTQAIEVANQPPATSSRASPLVLGTLPSALTAARARKARTPMSHRRPYSREIGRRYQTPRRVIVGRTDPRIRALTENPLGFLKMRKA